MTARGIRNNNPGNIELNNILWEGLSYDQTDGRFCQFVTPAYGIRAIFRIMRTYHQQYGLHSISQILSRWAPDVENNTPAYVNHVASAVGFRPLDPLPWERGIIKEVVKCIIRHENGEQPYDDELIEQAIELSEVFT